MISVEKQHFITIKIRRKQKAGEMSHKSFCTINTREHCAAHILSWFFRFVCWPLGICVPLYWICFRCGCFEGKHIAWKLPLNAIQLLVVKRLLICYSLSKIVRFVSHSGEPILGHFAFFFHAYKKTMHQIIRREKNEIQSKSTETKEI